MNYFLRYIIPTLASLAFLVGLLYFYYKKVGFILSKFFYHNHITTIVFFLLRTLVIFSMVLFIIQKNIESTMLCILTLLLFTVPSTLLEKTFNIDIPETFEVMILCFIFAACFLGEVNSFYVRVPGFDTVLHTINGFLCAAIGFSLVNILNNNEKLIFDLSPLFMAIVAFSVSMTVGVMWEFCEYTMDHYILHSDMQKDAVVYKIDSVFFDDTMNNVVIHIDDIDHTTITTKDGKTYTVEGYLDLGLNDTIKDLFVNFIGAGVFSIFGYVYLKKKKDIGFIRRFMWKRKSIR